MKHYHGCQPFPRIGPDFVQILRKPPLRDREAYQCLQPDSENFEMEVVNRRLYQGTRYANVGSDKSMFSFPAQKSSPFDEIYCLDVFEQSFD